MGTREGGRHTATVRAVAAGGGCRAVRGGVSSLCLGRSATRVPSKSRGLREAPQAMGGRGSCRARLPAPPGLVQGVLRWRLGTLRKASWWCRLTAGGVQGHLHPPRDPSCRLSQLHQRALVPQVTRCSLWPSLVGGQPSTAGAAGVRAACGLPPRGTAPGWTWLLGSWAAPREGFRLPGD